LNLKTKLTRFNKLIIAILFICSISLIGNSSNLKREFRGAWVATVKNIDWPSAPGLPAEIQKSELRQLFNSLHETGINAVIFQIRTECDALYPSQMEPWSYWISGKQGKPPDALYDPLYYAINLAKQRGMEFHAWINPFRVKTDSATYIPGSTYIWYSHPEWIIQSGKYKFLNPGIPEVRDYVKQVVLDVVKRYDINGIQFDDYFYPYSGITTEDIDTFTSYSRGFSSIDDWRRDNVNIFVREIYSGIKQLKPYVKFGISPFGIWKNDIPQGISGLSAFHSIYCDAVYWLQENIVDYIAPQIYWQIGGDQDYVKLSNWWVEKSSDRQLYIGQALYKMDRETDPWEAKDITEQINFNQNNENIKGSIFFRSTYLQNNLNGIADSLKYKYFNTPALIPKMTWIDSIPPPLFPFNLIALPSLKGMYLRWENPKFKDPTDQVKYNVVYKIESNLEIDMNDAQNILAILPASQSFFIDTTGRSGIEYTYLVTALDRLYNESEVSNTAGEKYSRLELINSKASANKLFDMESGSITNHTKIKFSLEKTEMVSLSLFNQNGEKILNLINEELNHGTYVVRLNYENLQTGQYHYKLTTALFSDMKSFVKNTK
jgi:uncharacterized lipoprotein YddW (UPF0748 family)